MNNDDQKDLASPFATGNGGGRFENQVQTCFAVLMLSEGICPCLRRQIKKLKLQGRYAGFNTDDFIAFAEDRNGLNKAKLLAQIKHKVAFIPSDQAFKEALTAAWLDFKNPEVFTAATDQIALITGPLSATDIDHVRPLMAHARHSDGAHDFMIKMSTGNFVSEPSRKKLQTFRDLLKVANGGVALSDEEVWQFLRLYHVLGYDFDQEYGTSLSLIESHIAQFEGGDFQFVWEGVSGAVSAANQDAGTLTKATMPQAILNVFAKTRAIMPQAIAAAPPPAILTGDQGDAVMFAALLGSWNDKTPGDINAAKKLIDDA